MISQGLTLDLRISPNAKRNKILGLYGDKQIKVSVACPPVDGRANQTLVKFIAETFSVSKKNVEIIRGETSQTKTIFISGDSIQLKTLLQKILADSQR
jgi:hypothetical protein